MFVRSNWGILKLDQLGSVRTAPATNLAALMPLSPIAEKMQQNGGLMHNDFQFNHSLRDFCMLIEFSVTNFRSIRERQTLSMVAAPRLQKKANVFRPIAVGEKLPELLKVAAIFGPNASGKSNLIRALRAVSQIATAKPGESNMLPVDPFRFDVALLSEPSRFGLHFIYKGLRYQFDLAATKERIIDEKLTSFPSGKETLIYERTHVEEGADQYHFGALEGGADLHETWRKLTGATTLFIAQAVANSSEELNQLRRPFEWIQGGMLIMEDGMATLAEATQRLVAQGHATGVSSFLQEVDVPITAMRVEPHPEAASNRLADFANMNKLLKKSNVKGKTIITHRTALGEAEFGFDEESKGTQGLIGFWLPWNLVTSENPIFELIVVDELDSSLHPEIVANLVKKYLECPTPAQLIFSTHDTHLMNTKLLRRDQYWLTERDMNGATQLRSIHDFDGREGEDVEKRYYEGKYRSLPLLRKSPLLRQSAQRHED